ncbi:site-specific integrase [Magnetovibrio sp.]|uniref:tyrosine-type recombinase/integrase n=1 Tax=Magnetovibrio sp. TaxID=2024836 RepID=UPI002F92AEF6
MASIRQLPSGRFNVQIRHPNTKQKSKSFPTKAEAEAWAAQIESEHLKAQAQDIEQTPSISFEDLGTRYCSLVLKGRTSFTITKQRIERMAQHLPKRATAITKRDINTYRLMRLEQVSSVSCRDELQLIHRIYRWAHREMLLDETRYPSPCTGIAMPPTSKPRNRVVERDELELLLNELQPIMRVVVELAYETAMRRGEILKLTPKNLHLEDRILDVVDGKTGDRSVPLTKRAVELLRESLEACPSSSSRLFPVEPHSVSTAFRRARKRAGLDSDVRFHQLRHSRITMVARKGFNQAQIMMVSGHRDVRSVQRYTHLNVMDVINHLD